MVKQVIVMRTKYNGKNGPTGLRTGKLIAQGCHASCSFLSEIASGKREMLPIEKEWLENSFRKICVGVDTEEELVRIHESALQAGLVSHLITDNGATEFGGVKTKTCLAIGPDLDEKIDAITGNLKLL